MRQELEAAKSRINLLEQAQEDHKQLLATGELIWKRDVDSETENLTKKLMAERGQRIDAEGSRKEIEKELEDLTRSLFEEANRMVAVERIEKAGIQERNDHLTTQLKDTEILLSSHQAQLEELKVVMQKMSIREELHDARPESPNPIRGHVHRYSRDSMKGIKTPAPLSGSFPSPNVNQLEIETENYQPELAESEGDSRKAIQDPEEFAGMLMPRYRIDIAAYTDFLGLLHVPKSPIRPSLSRAASASSLQSPKIPSKENKEGSGAPDRTSSPSLDKAATSATTLWNKYSDAHAESKKDKEFSLANTKFLKRALVEDIEPTLRLDLAPDLGYLARRAILNAVVDGHLIVEPMPTHLARFQPERQPCALCGDARYTAEIRRNFRLKTSERIESQPYPLCNWCTDRVRSVCTYVAFLKQVKDGLWKVTNETEELRVWEESVRLREGMFWCRVGHILDQ